ncbi:MAG: hypothetical protein JW760_13755, partial [Spirochaetales bacterium]|nr:hypothetical protein [Spirochaetales bacterium]
MRFLSSAKKAPFLFLFFLLTGILYAEPDSFMLLPLVIQFSHEETLGEGEKQLLTTLAVNEITGTDGKIVVRDLTPLLTDDRTIETNVSEELVTTGLAGWLFLRFEKQADILHLAAEYRTLEGNRTVFSLENSDYLASVFRNPERLFSELKESVRRFSQQRENEQYSAPLVIHGPAESILLGCADGDIHLNAEGTAVLDLTAPALYSYTLHSSRHYPDTGTFFLDVSGKELTLQAEKRSPLFLDVYLADFNVPGMDFGIRFGRYRRGFVKVGGYSYLLTLIPMLEDSEEEFG